MKNDRGKPAESYFAGTNDQLPQKWTENSELMLFEKNNARAKAVG
jgi:hypothetical protein